ncbi:MAG: hypothetical protein AAFX87_29265 [Bacteroidota bacterium]
MESQRTQILGGVCAILEALIYISAFIIYGGVLIYPAADASIAEKLQFLSDSYITLSILNLVSYVLFGILLAGLVLGIHQRLKAYFPILSKLVFAFGVIWVGLVIASGMIANIGLNTVINMGAKEPEQAMIVWTSVSVIAEGLGGGNEIVGGLWVLLLSIIAFKGRLFSIPLTCLGVIVGTAGILTIFPLEIFTEIFGLTQIVWFICIGVFMIRQPSIETEN